MPETDQGKKGTFDSDTSTREACFLIFTSILIFT